MYKSTKHKFNTDDIFRNLKKYLLQCKYNKARGHRKKANVRSQISETHVTYVENSIRKVYLFCNVLVLTKGLFS